MTDGRQAGPWPFRPGATRRTRRRWAAAAAVAAGWLLVAWLTGSVIAGTAVLLLLGTLGGVCVLGLRSVGVGPDHPWVRQLAARPWRDGPEVLQLALRHLADVFVLTPSGTVLAPTCVQLRLSPRDFASLSEVMDIGLASSSAAEVYEDQVAARGARFAGPGPAEVNVISDPALPAGRYALRQGRPPQAVPQPGPLDGFPGPGPLDGFPGPGPLDGFPGPGPLDGFPGPGPLDGFPRPQVPPLVPAAATGRGFPHVHDGHTSAEPMAAGPVRAGLPTMTEPARPVVPLLRLVTGGAVTQTRMSGACAGRGAADLVLPEIPTVSREHARFTFAAGQWWVTNLGRNGLTLNGAVLDEAHALHDGDVIRWGRQPDAPASRVEIG